MTTHGDQYDVIGARPVRIRQAGAAPGSEQAVRDHRWSAEDSFVRHHYWSPDVVTGEWKEEEFQHKLTFQRTPGGGVPQRSVLAEKLHSGTLSCFSLQLHKKISNK